MRGNANLQALRLFVKLLFCCGSPCFVLPAIMLEIGRAAELGRPNVLVILADDLGFSDLGCFGGEIETPNLDSLASNGLRYTQFYNTARCWPTRAALLTGYYAQQVQFDALPGVSNDLRKRPPWARLLPQLLRPMGYRSYHSGKWHLDGGQLAGGFDRSYSLDDQDRFFSPQRHTLDEKPLPAVKRDSGYYATKAIVDHAIEFLQEHAQHHADSPFFAYVAFTAPHFPLHAIQDDVARYVQRYQVGWDVIRGHRWQRIKQMLRLPGELSALEPRIGPPSEKAYQNTHAILGSGEVYRELSWNELTSEQQAFQVTKMAIHAAMVDRMDREIGRLIQELRAMDALADTIIFFFSDNGASAEILVRGDGHDTSALPGSADTFFCLGPGWSRAANTPFRRHKQWVHEGGIATPLIVHWPAGIAARGELRHAVAHVIDLVPTILHLAGGVWPAEFAGRAIPPAPGRNLAPTFHEDVEIARDYLWWLHQENRAIRVDDWKLVASRDATWELYNLANDRAENHDLAAQHPEKVRELEQLWLGVTREFEELATGKLGF